MGKAIFNVEILANSILTSIGKFYMLLTKNNKNIKEKKNKEKRLIPLTEGIFFLKI